MPVIVLVSWGSTKLLKKLFLSPSSLQTTWLIIIQEINATFRILAAAKSKHSPKSGLNSCHYRLTYPGDTAVTDSFSVTQDVIKDPGPLRTLLCCWLVCWLWSSHSLPYDQEFGIPYTCATRIEMRVSPSLIRLSFCMGRKSSVEASQQTYLWPKSGHIGSLKSKIWHLNL